MSNEQSISVVIPIFNQEEHIVSCIESLQLQTIGFDALQIILIDDGSSDNSYKICSDLAQKHHNIVFHSQSNKGVSVARNWGIKHATGKYIFYLDADDSLAENTIEEVTSFFDIVEDDVDLVTYIIETHYNGEILAPHFRYQFLNRSGVYHLRQYAYIGQTTMNIAVRNRFEENVLFNEKQTFSEDQEYCCNVLKASLKMGFCDKGKYIYHRSNASTSGQLSGACYIFEQCMRFFEDLFQNYEEVPLTFQGLYVNDVYWKLCCNILLPWHYKENEYREAVARIVALLNRCRDDVIIQHPHMDFFEKYYLLRVKENNKIQYLLDKDGIRLYDRNSLVLYQDSVEAVISKLRIDRNVVYIDGFLKSVFFQFYEGEISLYAIENNNYIQKLELIPSSHNYYISHESTQRFWAFRYSGDLKRLYEVYFKIRLGEYEYPITYYFMPLVSLSHIHQLHKCTKDNYLISVEKNQHIIFRHLSQRGNDEIWLYYDCIGVVHDNGRIQFEHDVQLSDGVKRYYILSDERQKCPTIPDEHYVEFGSQRHKELLTNCKKIITAYIEDSNLFPYKSEELDIQSNQFDFEIIYLQHGVLHFLMPWKYSRERLSADRIVVSTKEEADLWMSQGYDRRELIYTGMPRLEQLKKNEESSKKILFAPSWRSYLVGEYEDHQWKPLEGKFVKSKYYREISQFLLADNLKALLEEYDYTLDVKLHPIFQIYRNHYKCYSDRIHFVDRDVLDGAYDLMITDFSSYAYNFHYLNIPVIHFIPDEEEFKCGMNGYRELNYSEEFWNHATKTYDETINRIQQWLRGAVIQQEKVHFYSVNNRLDLLYQSIIGG